MEVIIHGKQGYIKEENIVSAHLQETGGNDIYVNFTLSDNVFSQTQVKTEEEGLEIIRKLLTKRETVVKKETYIDGFKAGLEYALKTLEGK